MNQEKSSQLESLKKLSTNQVTDNRSIEAVSYTQIRPHETGA